MRRGTAPFGGVVAILLLTAASCSTGGHSAGPAGGGAPTTVAAAVAREPGFAVTPASLPSRVSPGQRVTASFQARPGTACQLTLTDAKGSGARSPLPPAVADGSGQVSWTWQLRSDLQAGALTAWVSCSGGARGQAQLTLV